MDNKKVFKYLLNLDYLIAGIALIVLVAITFTGVIMRYFVNDPFVWLEEVQLMCFVWIVFFGAGAAFRSGSHVSIEFIVEKLPNKLRKIAEVLIYIIAVAILSVYMMQGLKLIQQLISTQRATNIFKIPYPLIYSSFPIGCILMIINYTIVTYKTIFSSDNKDKAGEI